VRARDTNTNEVALLIITLLLGRAGVRRLLQSAPAPAHTGSR
jgi:hypothetical protein